MGLLVEGKWKDIWYDTKETGGKFIREDSQFRNWILPEGERDNKGQNPFPAVPGRYHLFVSLACPWACRALIFRSIKKLKEIISISIVKPEMLENGWEFDRDRTDALVSKYGFEYLHQVYTHSNPEYSGRVTVPVLWDKYTETIVNNESSEIIRMLNSAFNAFTEDQTDYYPESIRKEIDTINDQVYHSINNGVYRCGFATTQSAYEEAFTELFTTLDWLDHRLSSRRYLFGDSITEADWRLFTTLIRFDAVYYGHFKTNLRRIKDYPNLYPYTRDLYQFPGVKETVDFHHIKTHYYYSHDTINPTRIVPKGPEINLEAPHRRERLISANGGNSGDRG